MVSPVSVTSTTVPNRSVTNLRHRWVSQKNCGPETLPETLPETGDACPCAPGPHRWHDADMRRLTLILVSTVLVAAGGAASAEVVNGTAADDHLRGTSGDDTLRGKPGNDRLVALGGDDLLKGGPGRDTLNGGPGLDDIGGGDGNDVILAGRDSLEDRTYGEAGNDTIYVFGDDQVSAGAGNDLVVATYPGGDMFIICGPGRDEVVFNEPAPPGTVTTDDCEYVHVVSAGRPGR